MTAYSVPAAAPDFDAIPAVDTQTSLRECGLLVSKKVCTILPVHASGQPA
jgi:hypothetical protein